MRVKDVMRKQVRTIKPDEPVSMAKEMFRRYDIHHLVVVEKKDVVGIIGDRDVLNARSEDMAVDRAMMRDPVTIHSDETVRKAAALMTGHVVGSLPVVDDGVLVGIVTSFDLLNLLAKGATHPAPNKERRVLAKRGPRKNPASSDIRRASTRLQGARPQGARRGR